MSREREHHETFIWLEGRKTRAHIPQREHPELSCCGGVDLRGRHPAPKSMIKCLMCERRARTTDANGRPFGKVNCRCKPCRDAAKADEAKAQAQKASAS